MAIYPPSLSAPMLRRRPLPQGGVPPTGAPFTPGGITGVPFTPIGAAGVPFAPGGTTPPMAPLQTPGPQWGQGRPLSPSGYGPGSLQPPGGTPQFPGGTFAPPPAGGIPPLLSGGMPPPTAGIWAPPAGGMSPSPTGGIPPSPPGVMLPSPIPGPMGQGGGRYRPDVGKWMTDAEYSQYLQRAEVTRARGMSEADAAGAIALEQARARLYGGPGGGGTATRTVGGTPQGGPPPLDPNQEAALRSQMRLAELEGQQTAAAQQLRQQFEAAQQASLFQQQSSLAALAAQREAQESGAQRQFLGSESMAARQAQMEQGALQRQFAGGESAADRFLRQSMAQQEQRFIGGESAAQRALQQLLASQEQQFLGGQGSAERASRLGLQQLVGTQETGLERLKAQLGGEAEAARFGRLPEILKMFPFPRFPGQVPLPSGMATQDALLLSPNVDPQMDPNRSAERAIFGRAAERQGALTQGALRGLENALAGAGFAEAPMGGAEAALKAAVTSQGTGALGDLIREQSIQELLRSQEVQDRNLQAGLTQRGQDIDIGQTQLGFLSSLLQLALAGGGRAY